MEEGRLYGQDFNELRQEHLVKGKLFQDDEFPPDDQSLYFSRSAPYHFIWKRPSEIVAEPRLFKDGASRFDINQV